MSKEVTSPLVLVVIPAYNEHESILATVNKIKACGYDYVVVNDGSKDDTLEICRSNGLNVLDLPQNLGIGGAVQAGHKYAQRNGYDIDVQVDGDGQHDPTYIKDLVALIQSGASSIGGLSSVYYMIKVSLAILITCVSHYRK